MSTTNVSSKATLAARIVLGLAFFVFGLDGFLHFMPHPASTGPANDFATALMNTGYMFPLIKGTEVIAGALILSGRFVPLALTILAPVVVNILAFHAFLAPATVALPLILAALGVYLAWTERAAYAPLFVARSRTAKGESLRPEAHAVPAE